MFLRLYDEMSSLTESLGSLESDTLEITDRQQQVASFFFFLEVKWTQFSETRMYESKADQETMDREASDREAIFFEGWLVTSCLWFFFLGLVI